MPAKGPATSAPKKTGAAAKLPSVPESILKRRQRAAKLKAKSIASALKRKRLYKRRRHDIFRRAEKYVKEYRTQERDIIRLKKQAKLHGNFYVPSEPKLALVIRIRGYVLKTISAEHRISSSVCSLTQCERVEPETKKSSSASPSATNQQCHLREA